MSLATYYLKIKTEDFNKVAKKQHLLSKLRELSLGPDSGLNYELDQMGAKVNFKKVKAKILLAYFKKQLIGWALLSKEETDYAFSPDTKFDPIKGALFQVYVHPDFRNEGIGTELLKMARKKAGNSILYFCPWDKKSIKFFAKFKHYKHECL